jgi:D-lactate dehydrogenase
MKVAVFNTKPYDRQFLDAASTQGAHELLYFEPHLTRATSGLAASAEAVCIFVNDQADAAVIAELARAGVRLIALRCAGFNNVDLAAARREHVAVARVPAYSPHAVAEHTLALILALNRKIHRAYNRVREGNFALDGLLGFDLYGKIVGLIGTGRIGTEVARILTGFGCRLIASDPLPNGDCSAMGVRYVELAELFAKADIISIHCPLTPDTRHLVNDDTLRLAKPGVMLINTSRGAVVETRAVIRALKARRLGSLGMDVYEEEAGLFFEDLSGSYIGDDVFARLMTFPNVLITGHQGFFTAEALTNIAETTIANLTAFERTGHALHELTPGPAP